MLFAANLDFLFHPGREPVGRDHPSARVPAKKRVVVLWRAEGFGLFKPFHRFGQELVSIMAGAGMALLQPGLALPLTDYARVVGALITIVEPGQNLLCLPDARGVALAKGVGQGE